MADFDFDDLHKMLSPLLSALVNRVVPTQKPGTLGYLDSNGAFQIQVPNRGPRVYVTTENTVIEAVNAGVPLVRDFPVIVTFIEGREPIVAAPEVLRAVEYLGTDVSGLGVAPHTHRLGFGNVDLVEGLRFEPGLVVPASLDSLTVKILEFPYKLNDIRYRWLTTTITPEAPSGSNTHRWTIIGIDTSTTPHSAKITYGTAQAVTRTLTTSQLPAIDFTGIPLAAIRIRDGQTNYDVVTQFVDERYWFGAGSSSSAAGYFNTLGIPYYLSDGSVAEEV